MASKRFTSVRLQWPPPGVCPSGQRERAVNPSAQPTEVRILPPPSSSSFFAPCPGSREGRTLHGVSELRRSVHAGEGPRRRRPVPARAAREPGLLQLQRAAGNRATTMLVQRTIYWQESGGRPSSAL